MSAKFSFTGERLAKISGVYSIIHRDTGMIYVGSSNDMNKRIGRHLSDAREGGPNRPLYRAIRMFGAGAFDFEVLELCEKEKNIERENFYIALFDSASIAGLNVMNKAAAPNFGYKPSASSIERNRLAQLGKKRSPETCAKIGAINKGRKRSLETCERIRLANIGRKHSQAAKDKVSAAVCGRVVSLETRAKMSASMRGLKRSEESRRNIHAAKQNVSNETRAKMSVSQTARWQRELAEKPYFT